MFPATLGAVHARLVYNDLSLSLLEAMVGEGSWITMDKRKKTGMVTLLKKGWYLENKKDIISSDFRQ